MSSPIQLQLKCKKGFQIAHQQHPIPCQPEPYAEQAPSTLHAKIQRLLPLCPRTMVPDQQATRNQWHQPSWVYYWEKGRITIVSNASLIPNSKALFHGSYPQWQLNYGQAAAHYPAHNAMLSLEDLKGMVYLQPSHSSNNISKQQNWLYLPILFQSQGSEQKN